MKNNATYKSIDLFAGIGGIRMGFDNAFGENIKTVFVSEWDEAAQKTYKANYDDEFEIEDPISSFEDEVVENVDVVKFLSKLDEKDKQILQLRQDGYTYKEIAAKVGFKTHSAVGKRINKIGRMYENYSGLNFGF